MTELDSVSSRPESPSNALNTSIGLTNGRSRRKRGALKSEALRNNEKRIRDEESDQHTDFIEYLELLVDVYKQLDHLDAAGCKLLTVFQQHPSHRYLALRNWVVNFDIWGSYHPLTPQCYDIQLTRTAAYTKVRDFRRQLKCIVQQQRTLVQSGAKKGPQGNIMKNFLSQVEAVDFYFSKIEVYFSRKHKNQMLKMKSNGGEASDDGASSDYSGSPKSSYSDRLNTFEEEDLGATAKESGTT